MKWKWVYIAIGGTFIVKMVESGRTKALVDEAMQIREATKKPIMLISSSLRQGFDVHLNPAQAVTWQLPYLNKAFSAIVSDALEEIQYPQEAVAEWQRIADAVLINTHSVFSPEAWLDFRHQYVFMGSNTIPINPSLNWAVAGGLGYYLYRRQQRKKLAKSAERKQLPETEEIIEEEPVENPDSFGVENPDSFGEEIEEMEAVRPERKALPAPIDGVKVELAPLINPDDLVSGGIDILDGIDITSGVNLGIGSEGAVSEQLQGKGVTNLIFNPMTMPQEHNQAVLEQLENSPADSATLVNVLSKVKDTEERKGAVQVAYENLKSGGRVFIKDKNPKKYLSEIKQLFPDAKLKGGVIVATKT